MVTLRERLHWKIIDSLPKNYFKAGPPEHKEPIAPVWRVFTTFGLEFILAVGAFCVMGWFFATQKTPQTTVTGAILDGQTCSVLNPQKGVVYYSKEHTENAQFASPRLNQTDCVSLLNTLKVCDDGVRYDHLLLLGVVNPNNSHYF